MEAMPKVLIVDDDPQIQELLTEMLSHSGLRTEVAGDGFEAGIKVMSFKPGLIILDLFMPGMDGFEVCKRIKKDRNTSHIKILVITGYDTVENRARIIREGADYFLPKPLDRETILSAINLLFDDKGLNHTQKTGVA